jgi:Calcium binding
VPLSQLKVVHGNDETQQAVDDWHYVSVRDNHSCGVW